MGTRADFYTTKDSELEWLGSIAWDGYEISKDLEGADNEKSFLDALQEYKATRNDWTAPEDGWPWPWKDSCLTDYAYVFNGKQVDIYIFGRLHIADGKKIEDREEMEKVDIFPDMKEIANVTDGGFIVLSA